MTSFRGRAGWLAASVLLVQVLALGASAAMAAVCCRLAVTSAKTMACCREKGHSCPLMKKQAPADPDGAAMKSCPGTDERIASLVFGGRGVLAAGIVSQVIPHVAAVAETLDRSAVSRPAPVDTPPPRA